MIFLGKERRLEFLKKGLEIKGFTHKPVSSLTGKVTSCSSELVFVFIFNF